MSVFPDQIREHSQMAKYLPHLKIIPAVSDKVGMVPDLYNDNRCALLDFVFVKQRIVTVACKTVN